MAKKTATRISLDILANKPHIIDNLLKSLSEAKQHIKICEICHNLDDISPCSICINPKKTLKQICVVESVEDLWVIDNSNFFTGKYHILGGTLSAVRGVGVADLNISSLQKRIEAESIDELVIAIGASLDGQTTSIYLSDLFEDKVEKITKLGYGIPLGSEIGYLDEGTLNAAFASRTSLK